MECRVTDTLPLKSVEGQPVRAKKESWMEKFKTRIYACVTPSKKKFENFLLDHTPRLSPQIEKLSQINALSKDVFNLLTQFLDTQSVLALLMVNTGIAWRLCVNKQDSYS